MNFENWFSSLGLVTKYSLLFSVGLTALSSFGVVSPHLLILTRQTITGLQLWRPITAAFFLGNFSFEWLMSFAMFVSYLKQNEESNFKNKPADYVWMLAVLIGALTVCSLFLYTLPVTSFPLMMALCWIFCKRNPGVRLSLFGFEFNANIFPWVLMGFHIILGQQIMGDVFGIAAGHLFLFVSDILPATHGYRVLDTPQWVRRLVKTPQAGPQGFTISHDETHPGIRRYPQQQQQQRPAQHNWGTGRHLGSR